MRFDAPFEDDDAPVRPKSIVPPVDRTSRAIHIKLMMLFVMLIVVVFLMQEAGKPERWQWMGFQAPESSEIEVDSLAGDAGNQQPPREPISEHSRLAADPIQRPAEPTDDSPPPITIKTQRSAMATKPGVASAEFTFGQPLSSVQYPAAAVSFWSSTFPGLAPKEQTTFCRLLKTLRLSQTLSEGFQPATQNLVQKIAEQRDSFEQSLFDQLALTPDGTPEKTRLAEELFESQDLWSKKILPALESGAQGLDFTLGQQQAIKQLQGVIDPLLYLQVQDHTSLGWSGDSGAWSRLWEKSTADDSSSADPVSRIELMGQPELYRGRLVSVSGWVRSARKKLLGPDSELGIPHYFVLWVRPVESKQGPYCVFSTELPAGFPDVGEPFLDMNERVEIHGYPFKIRSYIAADSSVEPCPVIIARQLTRIENAEYTSVTQWQPSRTTLMMALILIPLFASFLAWAAFRSSQTRPFTPGKKTQTKIGHSLNELANDPRVQTDRENVMRLYETDLHD